MKYTQFKLIEYILMRLKLEEVEDINISPCPRNTPIIEALVFFGTFNLHVIPD